MILLPRQPFWISSFDSTSQPSHYHILCFRDLFSSTGTIQRKQWEKCTCNRYSTLCTECSGPQRRYSASSFKPFNVLYQLLRNINLLIFICPLPTLQLALFSKIFTILIMYCASFNFSINAFSTTQKRLQSQIPTLTRSHCTELWCFLISTPLVSRPLLYGSTSCNEKQK